MASAARAVQLSCHPCFVAEKEGSKPGEPPAPNPTSKDTSGKPFQSPRKKKKKAGVGWCAGEAASDLETINF